MTSSQRGFSLLEVLVASIVFSVISGAVVALLYQSQRALRTQGQFNQTGIEARIALDQIIRSLRHAGNDPQGALEDSGTPPIAIFGPWHFRINSDITGSVASTSANTAEKKGDPDGALDAIYEVIEYRYDSPNKQLLVNVGYGDTVLANEVESFDIDFLDADGAQTMVGSEAVGARILLVAATETNDAMTGRKNLITLRSEVMLRSKTFDLYSLF